MSISERRIGWLFSLLVAFAGTGCVEHALIEAIQPTEYPIPRNVTKPPPTDGAIWRGGTDSGSFLYFDRKARGVGDLVTVVMLENLSATGSANTSLERGSDISASVSSDLGLTDILQTVSEKFLDLIGVTFTGTRIPAGTEVNAVNSSTESGYEGSGSTDRASRFSGVVTCRVVEVLPGGVLHIYGNRRILVNHELQLVTVDGLVRRKDIQIDNTVASTQLADAKLTFDGIGVVDDPQRPPLLSRLIAWIYPF